MLYFKNNQLLHDPILDLRSAEITLADLRTIIEDYIYDNRQKIIYRGHPLDVFYISGLAQYHHARLADYLNQTLCKYQQFKALLQQGTFAKYPTSHYWVEINDLIIDLTIKQFNNKLIDLPKPYFDFLNCSYFASDNKINPFYLLYQK